MKYVQYRAKSLQHLRLPERLLRLKDEQQSGALVALQQVDESLRQAVLDEWDARCRNSAVRNPAGYLFGIIQKAIRGEFKAWAGEGGSPSTPPAPPPRPAAPAPSAPPPPAPNGPGREAAQAYLAKLRSTLGDSSSYPQGIAGTRSLPGIGFGSVMRRTVAAGADLSPGDRRNTRPSATTGSAPAAVC
jgi:hypothetical protein